MILGQRLRQLREEKKLRQGDIEQRSGLLRCYISRVENDITVPSIVTLEKIARSLEVPMYRLFYDGEPEASKLKPTYPSEWGSSGRDADFLRRFRIYLGKAGPRNRKILLAMASLMTQKSSRAAMGPQDS
jgi:transcriptional regulator with XRE-family HTH domain